MTRINIVPVEELTDQHLVAEYREIFMVGSSLQRTLRSKNAQQTLNNLPQSYTLNAGHVKFFYDKGLYLCNRYRELIEEMIARGMKPDNTRVWKYDQWPNYLFNDWVPTESERAIARERIALRISEKPGWYRKTLPLNVD